MCEEIPNILEKGRNLSLAREEFIDLGALN